MTEPALLSSRHNPLVARLRKLSREPATARKTGEAWIEGEHLLSALQQHGRRAAIVVVTQGAWARPALRALCGVGERVVCMPDELFERELSNLPSPTGIACTLPLPPDEPLLPLQAAVVLDRVQDSGNVGSILRSAAAFGVPQVLALQGTAALWSPKVLRSGMGAHFALRLIEGLGADDLQGLNLPWIGTSPHAALAVDQAELPEPCVWLFGHEGQGLAPLLAQRCAMTVRIRQGLGAESLNVAAAAAICLHESARRRAP